MELMCGISVLYTNHLFVVVALQTLLVSKVVRDTGEQPHMAKMELQHRITCFGKRLSFLDINVDVNHIGIKHGLSSLDIKVWLWYSVSELDSSVSSTAEDCSHCLVQQLRCWSIRQVLLVW